MEALELADGERAVFREYEEAVSRMGADAMRLAPPARNAVLAAYDLEPEAWVLRVVERVQSTALQDALLVLPFGKVVSLMGYLNIWAQRVSILHCVLLVQTDIGLGLEHRTSVAYHIFPSQNAPPSNCRESHYANRLDPSSETLAKCSSTPERNHWIQSSGIAVYSSAE
jgi:hypothetical protein